MRTWALKVMLIMLALNTGFIFVQGSHWETCIDKKKKVLLGQTSFLFQKTDISNNISD